MSVALLLITHEHIANNLLNTAHDILNQKIENLASVEAPMNTPVEEIKETALNKLSLMNIDEGILILTDLIGSTPFNIAAQLNSEQSSSKLVSGLNLPMLLKLANYRLLPLAELTEKALLGGKNGINKHE